MATRQEQFVIPRKRIAEEHSLHWIGPSGTVTLFFNPEHPAPDVQQLAAPGYQVTQGQASHVFVLEPAGAGAPDAVRIDTGTAPFPPELVKVGLALETADGVVLRPCCDRAHAFDHPVVAEPHEERGFSTADVCAERRRAFDALPPVRRNEYRRMFDTLEQGHNPEILPCKGEPSVWYTQSEEIKAARDADLGPLLRARIDQRVRPQGMLQSNDAAMERLRRLSASQLQVYESFGTERFQEAFEMFANGELRMYLGNGSLTVQPDSDFFFLFGEFALACAFLDVDRGFWAERARVMVATQEIFMRVYAPRQGGLRETQGRSLNHFNAQNYDDAWCYTGSEKLALRERYAGMSLEALDRQMTANVQCGLKVQPK